MGYQRIGLLLYWVILASLSSQCQSIPSEFSITGYDPKDLASDERLGQLFQRWRESHGKAYASEEEMARRFDNFKSNLKYVIGKNSAAGHTVGLNRFADMSNDEFRMRYLSKVKKPPQKRSMQLRRLSGRRGFASCDAPSSLDWRKKGVVTAVKDQGECGSCWSFSSTGAMEGINAISTGELISLSEQELVDCDTTNYGCEGGYMDYAFEWVISNGGIDSESNYPYTGVDGRCSTRKEERKVVSIDGYEDVEESDSALLCATVNQPISVGIDGSSIDFQLYTWGIYDGECSSDPDDIDHAVLIVGYGSEGEQDYWIAKNSWGTSWGMEGYIYIRRNTDLRYGVCAINAMASYPTKEWLSAPSPYPSPAVPPPPPPPSPSPPPPPPPTPVTPPPPQPIPVTPPPPPPTPIIPPPPPPQPIPVTPPPPPPTPIIPPPPPQPQPIPVTPPPPPPPHPIPVTPPPPPPAPVIPPPPPTPPPSPSQCGGFSYCAPGQTCCCRYEFYNFCLIYSCCEYSNGVCCYGSDYCCPKDYPFCDVRDGLCLKNHGDYLGVAAKKKRWAKHKLPWTEPDRLEKATYQSLQWKRNPFAAAR